MYGLVRWAYGYRLTKSSLNFTHMNMQSLILIVGVLFVVLIIIPTIVASVEGGYGADYNTTVEVGTGERLVDRAVVKLFELRGLLKDLPDPRY